MILAHIVNGSLLTLVYPVSIFCYALFEEIRPHKGYWKFVLLYTMIILILKAFIKAHFISNAIPKDLNSFLRSFRIGIESVNDDNLPSSYYIFEILIMLFVVIHMISLMLQGLWDIREIDMEAIDRAAIRVLSQQKGEVKKTKKIMKSMKKQKLQRSISEDLHLAINGGSDENYTFDEESKDYDERRHTFDVDSSPIFQNSDYGNPFRGKFENTIASRWRNFQSPIVYDLDLHHYDRDNAPNKVLYAQSARALTEYPYEEITIDEAQQFINDELSNIGIFQNYFQQTRKRLFKNSYFKRLFPSVSTQKPGRDFYAQMAMIQFIILVYTIMFFTFMERDYTDITSQKLQIRQFSALLVLAAFLQIFIMLLDRYIYIAKSFTIHRSDENEEEDIMDAAPSK